MITPTVAAQAVSAEPRKVAPPASAGFTGMFSGRSPAAAADAVWVPITSGALILVVGVMTLATGQPWLFAGLGPTAMVLAASPGHPTTRFHAIVLGHFTALVCGWVAVLLLGAIDAPTFSAHAPAVSRVWASAFAVAITALLQPSVRAYHPPAAATALLITLGVYHPTLKTALALMAGVLVMALVGEWLQRVRMKERPSRGRGS